MKFLPFAHSCKRLLAAACRIMCPLLLLVALQGCSAVKLAYNNAQELTWWWLDGYLDINDAQTPRVRDDLASLHKWHRGTELPVYADILLNLQKRMPDAMTPEYACALINEVEARFNALTLQAEPAVVALAMSLTPEQLQFLEHKYAKNDAAFRREWLSLTRPERRLKRYELMLERVEMIYGSLDEAQKNVIREQMEQSTVDAQTNFNDRQRRQQDAVQTLRRLAGSKPGYEEAGTIMRAYLQRSMVSPDPVFRQYADTLRKETCQRIAVAHNSTTPAQRAVAVRRLQAYERTFRELAVGK